MTEFWTLLFRFSFGLLCHSIILYLMTDRKYSRKVTLGVWLGTFALVSLAIVPLLLFASIKSVVFVLEAFGTLGIYCGVYLCLSRGSVWRNLFVFFAYATFFFFFLVLSSCVSQMFYGGSHYATVAGRTISMGLYIVWLIRKPFSSMRTLSVRMEKGWTSLALFSIFSGLTLYIAALTFMILEVDVGIRLAVSGILFLLIGSAYLVTSRTVILMAQEYEAQESEAQRRLLESQLAAEREFVTQAKANRHDLHHHLGLITEYLERGDLEGARTYLSQYEAELDADTLEVYCENAVANALLHRAARRCQGSAIPFTCRAVIPQVLPLTGPELSTILGNVLENAIEASRQSQTPWVSVAARTHGSTLLVEVRNAVSGETRFENELPVSTKPGGGQGLRSVSRVLEKHGGLLRCFRKGDTFFTQLVIPI